MANLLLIRTLSKERNITIRELANRVGIGEAALQSLIKNGSTNTSTLERIAKELNVSAGCFFDNNQIKQTGGECNAASIYGNASSKGNDDYKIKALYLEKLLEEKEKQIQLLNEICNIKK
ncbi:MAG: helix-turn-helix domain-containing protein [Bacteroidales bacterium]|jgi:transcriptional regulator with XRE-family HTH domain|nr:helix-turn-helix domain-containing protein [Bacteroidales bacterium]